MREAEAESGLFESGPFDSKSCAPAVMSAPRKDRQCSLDGVSHFSRDAEKWEIAVPSAWGLLPFPALVSVCCPFEVARELLQGAFPDRLALDSPGAAFHCCLNSQFLFLSLSLTTAAATRQGLPWSHTLS